MNTKEAEHDSNFENNLRQAVLEILTSPVPYVEPVAALLFKPGVIYCI